MDTLTRWNINAAIASADSDREIYVGQIGLGDGLALRAASSADGRIISARRKPRGITIAALTVLADKKLPAPIWKSKLTARTPAAAPIRTHDGIKISICRRGLATAINGKPPWRQCSCAGDIGLNLTDQCLTAGRALIFGTIINERDLLAGDNLSAD